MTIIQKQFFAFYKLHLVHIYLYIYIVHARYSVHIFWRACYFSHCALTRACVVFYNTYGPHYRYDWAHIYLIDGIASKEFGVAMHLLQQRKVTSWGVFEVYCRQWVLPFRVCGHDSTNMWNRLIGKHQAKLNYTNCDFNCTASDFLTVAPLAFLFMGSIEERRASENDLPIVRSCRAVLQVVLMLHAHLRGRELRPDELKHAIELHLGLHLAAHGESSCRTKHHMCLHLPLQLAKHGKLQACMLQERKHRTLKRLSRLRTVLHGFSAGMARDAWIQHLSDCESFLSTQLLSKGKPPAKAQRATLMELYPSAIDFVVHAHLRVHGEYIHTDDLVQFVGDETSSADAVHYGILVMILQIDGDLQCAIAELDCTSVDSELAHLRAKGVLAHANCTFLTPTRLIRSVLYLRVDDTITVFRKYAST